MHFKQIKNIRMKNEIGKQIKEKRIEMGMSQEDLANKSDVTKLTIWNIENGKNVSVKLLEKILPNVGLTFDVFDIV